LQKLLRVKQIENNKGKQLSQKVLTPIIRTWSIIPFLHWYMDFAKQTTKQHNTTKC
jgi:hypothetical protein